jgi:hypothetical protein
MSLLNGHTSEPLIVGAIVALITGLTFPIYLRCELGPAMAGLLSFLSGITAVAALVFRARVADRRREPFGGRKGPPGDAQLPDEEQGGL